MNEITIPKGTYSVTQIAQLTGYSGQYIRNLIAEGTLPAINMGRQFIITVEQPVTLKAK